MNSTKSGFSLIEITVAITLISTVLLGFVGVMAMGVKAASDSTRRTILGGLIADVHHRIEGATMEEGVIERSPLFYDEEGRFIPEDPEQEENSDLEERRKVYRVDVRLAKLDSSQVVDRYGDTPIPINEHASGLLAAIIELSWPVDEEGEVNKDTQNRDSMTYFVNTLSGMSWTDVDPDYMPVIEF
ncbi:MAG: prepilin-type N-terminal cleavage/methylation domain-containing protein [Verrucomicrobiota bacterium]